MIAMKRWQFWLGVLISVGFLYLALRGLRLGDLVGVIEKANFWWLIPGILLYFVAVMARAWRWHYLLRPVKSISTIDLFPTTVIGYMGNNVYPARAGEVLRALLLKRDYSIAISTTLATILVERIFDGVVMLSFIFINLPELSKLTGGAGFLGKVSIQDVAIWGSAIFFGALGVFLLAAMFPSKT
jgi:uncharacterized protein (TIRG00374 family)